MDNKLADNDIKELSTLCHRQKLWEEEIQRAEEKLKLAKEKHRLISEVDIPEKMMALGVSQLRLEDGTIISVDTFYSAGITEANKAEAYKWLEESGHGAMIKSKIEVSTGKGERELAQRVEKILLEAGVPFDKKDSVHWQTLRAFVREQIESGESIPMDLLGVHIGNRAKITKK